jgi:LuxR family maltose regulon positive regulatory protein
MLKAPQPPPFDAILTSLINDISTHSSKVNFVLDDYHLIETPAVHEALTFILDNLPPQLHLVIATREDPPLPLARLRARGQLTELRAADLRFTNAEAAEFLNEVMGLELAPEDIAALESRTEGWIAGLQLAAISLQGKEDWSQLIQSFSGSHHYVLDYLIEEVLEQQPAVIQTFLLQTTILERMNGSLCNAITGQEAGQGTLEALAQANLFIIPLDDERRWYRYHHLFADLLHQRLHQTRSEELPQLHRRASIWYEQNEFVQEAIDHALRGEAFQRAAKLIEAHYGDNYERVSQAVLQRWLAAIPEEFVISKPELLILQAWALFTTGQLEAAEQSLRAAEKMLLAALDERQLPDPFQKSLRGRIAALRSFLISFGGDNPRTIQQALLALDYLPNTALQWRSTVLITLGDAYANQGNMDAAHQTRTEALAVCQASGDPHVLMIVRLRLAEILRQQGKLQEVLTICEQQYKEADDNGFAEWTIVGWLLGIWGEALVERNELEQGLEKAKRGVKLAARGQDLLYEIMSSLCLVRVLYSCGDLRGAEETIQAINNTSRELALPVWATSQASAWRGRVWLAQGQLAAADKWAEECRLDTEGELAYLHELPCMGLARIRIAQGRPGEASALLERLLKEAQGGGRTSRIIEVLILQALALHAQEETDQALGKLEQALALAKPEGFIRTFIDEGPPLARLLYEALGREIVPDYVRRLLAAFPEAPSEKIAAPQTPDMDWVEPLSDREIEVLQLLAEGLTNQEIGARLYLSPYTIKAHTRNIYSKLDVHSRTQAVARARALGILTST